MKSLIRIISLSLAAAMVLSLCACKKEKPGDTPDPNPSSELSSPDISSTPSSSTESVPESSSAPIVGVMETPDPLPAVIINGEELVLPDFSEYENKLQGWGQGHQVNEMNRPVSAELFQEKYGDFDGIFIMPDDEKKMYLTFDEGYENGYTEKILDALKERQCPAVFFVTLPYVKANPDLIKRMIDEGHVVGNHSVKHLSMPSLTTQEAVDEIVGLHNYMVENYNYQMTLFRPPMGEWSTRTLAIAKSLGYKTVFWSYAYRDWEPDNQMGVEAAFPKVSGAAHNGAVYLLHAVSPDNAAMLPDLIDSFRNAGYSLLPLQ